MTVEEILNRWNEVIAAVTSRPANERKPGDVLEALGPQVWEEKEIIRQDLVAQGYDPLAISAVLDGTDIDDNDDPRLVKQAAKILRRAYDGRLNDRFMLQIIQKKEAR